MFDAVKVFSATKQKERDELGETVSRWLAEMRGSMTLVDKVVKQSSDHAYHCLTILLFYKTTLDKTNHKPNA